PEGWVEYYRGGGIMPMGGKGGYAEDMAISYPYPGGMNDSWDHEEGRTCFERTIDPEVYRPYGGGVD
ncbi:MAG: hypothetical protein ABH833_00710, partial [Parcubacteria group bacterium]